MLILIASLSKIVGLFLVNVLVGFKLLTSLV